MTVKELIEKLKTLDEDKEILYLDTDWGYECTPDIILKENKYIIME